MKTKQETQGGGWGPDTDWHDRASQYYSEPRNHALRPGGSEYGRYLWTRQWISPGSRVLDVGCNCGQLAKNLVQDLGCEVVGIDAVYVWVEYCRQCMGQFGHYYCCDFGETLTLAALNNLGQFDVVTALEVVEHAMDIRGFRANVRALLRPGGRLVITTPHPHGFMGWDFFLSGANPCHVRMWTRWRLEQVFGPALEFGDIYRDKCGRLLSLGAVFECEG